MSFYSLTPILAAENEVPELKDYFELPHISTGTVIFVLCLALLFAFLIFLFFSRHTACFYVDGILYKRFSATFMTEIVFPVPEDKPGMRFVGWYFDTELEEPAELPCHIHLFNVKFYAKFEPADDVSSPAGDEEQAS